MALLLNAQALAVRYGPRALFRGVSFPIGEGERLGLIGPNGSGKSTLLEILAGRKQADEGELAARKGVRLAYVSQISEFASGAKVSDVMAEALAAAHVPFEERAGRQVEILGRTGFTDFEALAGQLSGGWRKRLAIAEALVTAPDLLLLDEPTNHLDIEGIEWLESILRPARFAFLVVSHDRYFLENVAQEVAELNRIYPEGLLRVRGSYSAFLEKKGEFLAAQARHQESLQNRVRTELAWLRRGPKARATKAKARIDNAHELIGELKDLNARSRTATAGIDFTASERATKRLIAFENVTFAFGAKKIVEKLDFTVTAGLRVGLVGPNGSGKTTLLRLIRDEMPPLKGTINRAPSLRVVYFEQNRTLDPEITLRRALAPYSDSVMSGEQTIHVASWAARFLFAADQLDQPVGKLSGGERARVLIARLMLEPADVLLLDEPTNDLDIETLEILEENLLQFSGALVLVTHDRFMLDRVSNVVLGLDGNGRAERFADYAQWEEWSKSLASEQTAASKKTTPAPERQPSRKKLSYLDNRDFESIEDRITEAEQALAVKRNALDDLDVVSDPRKLQDALRAMEQAQEAVDALYARWSELEEKLAQ